MNSHFVSIDTETLGLGPNVPIIELGAMIQDWWDPLPNPPTFHCYVLPGEDGYQNCEPYAMSMHPKILRRIATREEPFVYLRRQSVARAFGKWLKKFPFSQGGRRKNPPKIVIAGKNYAIFDHPKLLANFPTWEANVKTAHRIIDVGHLFWHPWEGEKLPDLSTCAKRAGLSGIVTHTALEDAELVADLVIKGISYQPVRGADGL